MNSRDRSSSTPDDHDNLLTVVTRNGNTLVRVLDADTSPRAADLGRTLPQSAHPDSSGLPAGARGAVNVNALVTEVEQLLRPRLPSEIRWQALPDLSARPVRGDADQLSCLVAHLVVAARDAMPDGGDLWVATSRMSSRQVAHHLNVEEPALPWWVGLTVSDTGGAQGSPDLAGAFRAFGPAKTDEAGRDLSLVCQVIRDHGGLFRVTGTPASGTTVMVCFPEDQPPQAVLRPRGPTNEVTMSGGKETLLLVEDHDAVRALAAIVLRRQGYTVLEVSNCTEARERIREHPGSIDLLVADVCLQGVSGVELAKELGATRPGLKILFISGAGREGLPECAYELTFEFLAKPFSPPELTKTVRSMLDACSTPSPSPPHQQGNSPRPGHGAG